MFSSTILVLSVALSAVFAGATPFDKRQVGNAQCTLDRLQIVVDFAEAQRTVRALTVQLASDPAGTQGINAVSDSLNNGQDGIVTILNALLAGQNAPPAARDQVGDGIDGAATALASITTTDPAVQANLSKLHDELVAASFAGDGVVENCK